MATLTDIIIKTTFCVFCYAERGTPCHGIRNLRSDPLFSAADPDMFRNMVHWTRAGDFAVDFTGQNQEKMKASDLQSAECFEVANFN